MFKGNRGITISAAALCIALAAAVISARAQSGQTQPQSQAMPHGQSMGGTQSAPAAGQTAGERFKNIQVLKDIPADQLLPTMQFFAASLGVECNFCHVEGTANGRPELQADKDDKQAKLTARKMIAMTLDIDKTNFNARPQVTCYSCHRGANEPVGTPIIADVETPRTPPAAAPANMPTADQILAKYVQAVGGEDAYNKVTSRIEKGNILAQGQQVPITLYTKAPYMRMSITQMGGGQSITAFDGTSGWLGGGRGGPRDMSAQENVAAKLDADFHFATDLKQSLTRIRATRPDKIGDTEYYVLVGTASDNSPVRLYFDENSGLLVREIRYAQGPIGRLPTQIDYADYRDTDGVKIPFKWTLARVNGRFTIQIDSVQQNVPIDDSKFQKPAATSSNGSGQN
jgi:photosynthetic reaction center cytochrome c subunit